ncbi:probable lipoxygenase 8, chloroplastic isoform X2 [Phragmites australis]|uniref:probable lipoxygenase 8, chloroplastic isoform X2 n=1 Tax=Phragmites australis TaxID=29695 RepID=UPI002D795C71|nr:probable lipoxygenase 8, chloroplastic isoform X2 [Phragmites australis]
MSRPQLKPPPSHAHTCCSTTTRSLLFLPASSSLVRPSSLLTLGRPRRRGQTAIRCVSSPAAGSEEPSSGRSSSVAAASAMAAVRVKAVATIKVTVGGFLSSLRPSRAIDDVKDLIGRSLYLELVSSELDAKTGQEKPTLRSYAHRVADNDEEVVTYEADFDVPAGFGAVGAVLVTNEHRTAMLLEDVNLSSLAADDDDGDDAAPLLTIRCNSYVQPKCGDGVGAAPGKRVFFANKPYLPSQTPAGLQSYRKKDLEQKRGNGRGQRKATDRIYDYDVYNDLADPDNDAGKARPVLGGNKQFPYPRRCRTGRPPSSKDPKTETRSGDNYVPRDEAFSEVKTLQFSVTTLRSVLHAAVPAVQSTLIDPNLGFPSFFVVDKLFEDGVKLPKADQLGFLHGVVPRLLQILRDGPGDQVLLFDTPANVQKDKFAWLRDEEFARETLAGINPYAIELVREFPLKSKLDPAVYGPAESAITAEILERQMGHSMTVAEAVKQKRLFMLDYHDLFLPYVHKIRELEHTTMYGSRTIFFLSDDCTLRLLAIELTRPASPTQPQWRRVFTSSTDTTESWLWRMAKSHVRAHDSGHHELISHWLRTHCAVEPYIIAANRQLSEMHPIYQLMHPHFRYTMRINALARTALINAGGIIELSFSPQKYSMELSSVAYDQFWRFDTEALPADLIRRGMAEEDPKAEHGLKLTIKDYPFANDGLLIWDAIKSWVQAYVSRFYPDAGSLAGDAELQAFWTEVRTVGHGDKKDAPGWPTLDSPESLAHALTTMIWVASAHHAAVNFGQYDFGGYFPNRPSIARTNMPIEEPVDDAAHAAFQDNPDQALRECFPSQVQATLVMAVLDLLSTHSPDEEYLGGLETAPWNDDAAVQAAYRQFNARLKEIEGIIDARNTDRRLKNRCGAGIVPYQLMKPFSQAGVTGKGIPNSTSI